MSLVADAVKLFLVPGSIPFLVIGLVGGVALLYAGQRAARWGRAWLTGLLVVYALLSTPLGSDLLVAPLVGQFRAVMTPAEAAGADTIIVLSNGGEVYRAHGREIEELGKASAHNVLEAARLYRMLGSPTIIASGGIVYPGSRRRPEAETLADGLVRLGVPRERILVEGRSRTTREQGLYVTELLRARGSRRCVLVTAPDHIARAAETFRGLGVDPLLSVSTFSVPVPPGVRHRLRPSLNALRQSDWACYEYLARLYYWFQGWSDNR